jgi:diacylglycerol kinase family enzyme
MERLWLITNHASGSAGEAKCAAVEAIFAERGMVLAGRTVFPRDTLPASTELEAKRIDTVVLFAGDGTINAAVCALDGWAGAVLILPGGTMNMLAHQLHGDADPHAIVHAAHAERELTTLPFVEAGPHRAFVALIVGPAATWAHARELVRKRELSRVGRAVRLAWSRSWSREIRVTDGKALRGRYNAAIVTPAADNCLAVSAATAERWGELARLGWEWLTGNWHDAPAVDDSRTGELTVTGRRALHALFDGEEAKLPAPLRIRAGRSNLKFITTVRPA